MSERINIPFTNEHFVAFCEKMLGQPYWYGSVVYKCTENLRARKAKQYPAHYGSSRTARYRDDIAKKKVCADCVGLIKGYQWTNGGQGVIESIGTSKTFSSRYGGHGCPDKSANGMFSYAKSKGCAWGTMDTLPEVPGVALRFDGHVGVYVGNGYAVEERGFNYGCVRTRVKDRKWTHWYQLPFVDYGDAVFTGGGAAKPDTPASEYTLGTRTLKNGSKGTDVKALQEFLLQLGYPSPKWIHLEASGAKEVKKGEGKKTKAQCYEEMRSAAQAEFDKGCDLPTVTLKVDFINCADTEEYRQYGFLQNIFLGDAVRVLVKKLGISVSMRMTQYAYDCLTRRYTSVTLGTVADTLEGNTISSRQLPAGIISGSKLGINSVGAGQLQSGSVGSLQIQMAAIQTAHIETAAITSALIAEAAIQSAHIGDAQITSAKIADACITAAKIAEASITAACIQKASITETEIADASITAAKIALATITSAQIAEAAIATANIADLAVTAAKIADATITSAKIAQAAIGSAHIEDAAITRAKIALLAVDEARIADLAVTTAKIHDASITSAKIADLAVTGAKIANATITNANIANATVGTAQIALGAITTALIEAGAVGTAQIADASITDAKIVELSANRITTGTLSVERLIIVGGEKSIVYTINAANGTPQLSQTTIDGGSLTERSISADRIVAGAITAKEIASATILANNIAAGAITTDKLAAESVDASKIRAGSITADKVSSNFGQVLDLSSNTSIRGAISQTVDEAISGIEVGGANLVENSASYLFNSGGEDTFWVAADELKLGATYLVRTPESAGTSIA